MKTEKTEQALVVSAYRPEAADLLSELLERCPYNDLRRYRIINRAKQIAYARYRVEKCAADGEVLSVQGDGNIRAVAALRPLPWDSAIFGLKMGQVPLLIHEGMNKNSRAVLHLLVDELLKRCRSQGFRHLNIRVDADDLALVQVLEQHGFYLADTIVTYIFIPRRQKLPHFKYIYKTRVYREEDRDEVFNVAKQAYKNFIGRYHADPHLSDECAGRLYEQWADRLLAGGLAERIIVAERQGKIIGFLGYRMKRDILEATGIKVVGGGLGGCLPEGFGAYIAILEEAMREGMHRYDMQDFETQINNINVVRIYQKLNFEYARAKYTYHAWIT
jgi:hypothetical protein